MRDDGDNPSSLITSMLWHYSLGDRTVIKLSKQVVPSYCASYTSPLVGHLPPSVTNERGTSHVYLTCPVLRGSKTEV